MESRQEIDVRSVRTSLGWSQGRLAEYLGCDQSTVSRLENGGRISGPIRQLLSRLSDRSDIEAAA